jgi:hypothetical protein
VPVTEIDVRRSLAARRRCGPSTTRDPGRDGPGSQTGAGRARIGCSGRAKETWLGTCGSRLTARFGRRTPARRVRWRPSALRHINRRISGGFVSGRNAQIRAAALTGPMAISKNPVKSPNCCTRKPTEPVPIAAAMPRIVPSTPCAKLNRPVPVVRSVTTRMVNTVTAAPVRSRRPATARAS